MRKSARGKFRKSSNSRRGKFLGTLDKTNRGTPAEKRAVVKGLKAADKAQKEGKSKKEASAIGKKITTSQMKTDRGKTNVEALWLAASAVPIGGIAAKGAQAVKALANLGGKKAIKKKAAKAMEGTPPKSKTPFRSRKGNENKSQKALESGKAIPKTPSVRLTPPKGAPTKLNPKQKAAIKATTAVPVVLGANALLKNKPKVAKKPKPKPEAVKKPKPDLSFRPDEGSPAGTASKQSTTTYTPRKKYEGGIDFYETPFGKIKADSSDDAFNFDVEEKDGGYLKRDMMMKKRKKGGVVKRRMGGKVGGYGKALRGY